MGKQDLALNNQQRLICHKTNTNQPTNQPTNLVFLGGKCVWVKFTRWDILWIWFWKRIKIWAIPFVDYLNCETSLIGTSISCFASSADPMGQIELFNHFLYLIGFINNFRLSNAKSTLCIYIKYIWFVNTFYWQRF